MIRLLALLLWASPVWAQPAPLPDFDTCTVSWELAGFYLYQQTTPTGPAVRVGDVPVAPPTRYEFPCPTAQGTYYYTQTAYNSALVENVHSSVIAFTIKGGAPPPPPPVFQIGAPVKVNTALLNVRELANGVIKGQQKLGATATIANGPVDLPIAAPITVCGQRLIGAWRWWPLDYATGVDGWSAEVCLQLVPVP